MEKRINPETNKAQIKVQPNDWPPIWITQGSYCERCAPYKQCLRFKELTNIEWNELSTFILETNSIPATYFRLSLCFA